MRVQHPLPAALRRPLTEPADPDQPERSIPPELPPLPQRTRRRGPPPSGNSPPSGSAAGATTDRNLGRARWLVPATATLLVVLIAGGAGALALSRRHSGSGGPDRGGQSAVAVAAAARSQAAGWVSRQVSRSAIVSCDPAMCAVLQADGLSAANLTAVSSNTADPLGADVVVATPAVRSQFGRRLPSVYAPAVLARFGSGAAEIDVRVVAPGGAAAYRTALSQDVAARQSVSAQLLKNSRIQVAAAAQAQLAAGQVDARLLLMLAALAHVHPVRVLSFGDAGPGADAGMPLCSTELAGSYYPASMSQAGYVSWLQKFLGAQRPPYNSQTSTAAQQGQAVVTVRFAGPSPLGLLKDG